MNTPEMEEILASVQDLVRKSYAQGRADALKQVVQVIQADEAAARKPLALTAPPPAAPSKPAVAARASTGSGSPEDARLQKLRRPPSMGDDQRPWWVRLH